MLAYYARGQHMYQHVWARLISCKVMLYSRKYFQYNVCNINDFTVQTEKCVQCVHHSDLRHTANDVFIIRCCDQWSVKFGPPRVVSYCGCGVSNTVPCSSLVCSQDVGRLRSLFQLSWFTINRMQFEMMYRCNDGELVIDQPCSSRARWARRTCQLIHS